MAFAGPPSSAPMPNPWATGGTAPAAATPAANPFGSMFGGATPAGNGQGPAAGLVTRPSPPPLLHPAIKSCLALLVHRVLHHALTCFRALSVALHGLICSTQAEAWEAWPRQ